MRLPPDCFRTDQFDAPPKERSPGVQRGMYEACRSQVAKALGLDASMPYEKSVWPLDDLCAEAIKRVSNLL